MLYKKEMRPIKGIGIGGIITGLISWMVPIFVRTSQFGTCF